jgi:hypothetical protein
MSKNQNYGPGKLKLSFSEKMKILAPYVSDRFFSQVKSVWLIIVYLLAFQLIVLQLPIAFSVQIAVGIVIVVLGLMFFMEGLTLGLMPFGELIGAVLPRKAPLVGLLIFAFIIGIGATFAEPAIAVLQAAGRSVDASEAPLLADLLTSYSGVLVIAVGIGVGIAVIFGMIRFLYGWSLKVLIFPLIIILSILTIIALLVPQMFPIIGLAWDCGAVTTGPVTVPLVLALGIGVCRVVGSSNVGSAGFGVVTLASLFPILAVLSLGFILVVGDTEGKYIPQTEMDFSSLVERLATEEEMEGDQEAMANMIRDAIDQSEKIHSFREDILASALSLLENKDYEALQSQFWINALVPTVEQYDIEQYQTIIGRIATPNELQAVPGDRERVIHLLMVANETMSKLIAVFSTDESDEDTTEEDIPFELDQVKDRQEWLNRILETVHRGVFDVVQTDEALQRLRKMVQTYQALFIAGSDPIDQDTLEKYETIIKRIGGEDEIQEINGDRDKLRNILKTTGDSIHANTEEKEILHQALILASEDNFEELKKDNWIGKVVPILDKHKTASLQTLLHNLGTILNDPDDSQETLESIHIKIEAILHDSYAALKKNHKDELKILREAQEALTQRNLKKIKTGQLGSQIKPILKSMETPHFQTILMRIGTKYMTKEDPDTLINLVKNLLSRMGYIETRKFLQKMLDLVEEAVAQLHELRPNDDYSVDSLPNFASDHNTLPAFSKFNDLKSHPELVQVTQLLSDMEAGLKVDFSDEDIQILKQTGKLPEDAFISRYSGTIVHQEGELLIKDATIILEKRTGIDTSQLRIWNDHPIDESQKLPAIIQDGAINAVRAILPLVLFLFIVLILFLRERIQHPDEMVLGVGFAVFGMWLFSIGLSLGLTPLGDQVGSNVPSAFSSILPAPINGGIAGIHGPLFGTIFGKIVAIVFAFLLGYAATLAEPALNVLGATVEKITVGAFKKSLLMQAVAIGVGLGLGLGIVKLAFDVPLPYLLIPPYILLLFITFISLETFVNIGWDSAGVTTGPITVPLVLAMGLGIGSQVDVVEGFGVLAMASVMPILSVLTVGLLVGRTQSDADASEGGTQNA